MTPRSSAFRAISRRRISGASSAIFQAAGRQSALLGITRAFRIIICRVHAPAEFLGQQSNYNNQIGRNGG
jgi:hypothetical protein